MKHDLTINKLPGHETKGKVMGIQVKAGDSIKPGDLLFTIESGKGNMDFLSDFDGTLDSLTVAEGQTVKKNEKIGEVTGERVEGKTKAKPATKKPPAKKAGKNQLQFWDFKTTEEGYACRLGCDRRWTWRICGSHSRRPVLDCR